MAPKPQAVRPSPDSSSNSARSRCSHQGRGRTDLIDGLLTSRRLAARPGGQARASLDAALPTGARPPRWLWTTRNEPVHSMISATLGAIHRHSAATPRVCWVEPGRGSWDVGHCDRRSCHAVRPSLQRAGGPSGLGGVVDLLPIRQPVGLRPPAGSGGRPLADPADRSVDE
jgi:hypothetical protein